jgi:hypothetical protein
MSFFPENEAEDVAIHGFCLLSAYDLFPVHLRTGLALTRSCDHPSELPDNQTSDQQRILFRGRIYRWKMFSVWKWFLCQRLETVADFGDAEMCALGRI